MAIERWNDDNGVGTRLAAHRVPDLLSLDLEGRQCIGAIGAVHTGRSTTLAWKGGRHGLAWALAALDDFAEGAQFLVGHNIIEHDLELLSRHAPNLKLLNLPAIDTLYLSPLAAPENPYHQLVKQYKEPALARVQVNDPLLDAELTLELLADVADKLKPMDADLLRAWHALLASGVKGLAFDHLFRAAETHRRPRESRLRLLCISPERLMRPEVLEGLSRHGPARFAIDEALRSFPRWNLGILPASAAGTLDRAASLNANAPAHGAPTGDDNERSSCGGTELRGHSRRLD